MSTTQLPLLPLVLDTVPPGLRQALAQEGVPFVDRTAGKPAGRFLLFDSRAGNPRGIVAGQVAINIESLRRATAGDPFEDLLDERAADHGYRIGGFEYREEIARIDKRQVRRRLMDELRKTIENRGGIWLKLSAYPFPYRSVFNLRSNYHVADEAVSAALEDIAGAERATSHYLCGAEFEGRSDLARRFTGLDVGSLGYHRVLGEEVDANVENLRRGALALRRLGIEPRGYAPPHGRFSLALQGALEVVNASHCCALALAYDDLPFFPGHSRVLQLPAHPVPVGGYPGSWSNENNRRDEIVPAAAHAALKQYFNDLVAVCYQSGEPLLAFRQATPRLVSARAATRAILSAVSRCGAMWQTTLAEMAEWWGHRSSVQLRVVSEGELLRVAVEGRPGPFRLGAEYWRGEHVALLPLEESTTWFSPGALAFQCRKPAALPAPQRVDGAEGPRRMGRRWVKHSPRDDSGAQAFRDWMNRTLRSGE